VVLEKDEDQLNRSYANAEVLQRVKEQKNVLFTIKRRTASRNGHILLRKCLLMHVIAGNLEETERRERRLQQLLDDIK
jgi:hypothetical protein